MPKRVLVVGIAAYLVVACSALVDLPDRYVQSPDSGASPGDDADAPQVDGSDAEAPPSDDADADADTYVDADADTGDAYVPFGPTAFVRGPLVDFNADHYADYAERTLSTGAFRIYLGSASGGFTLSTGGGVACGPGSVPGCDVMLGDFDGDHYADFAEHDPVTGLFSIHRNTKSLSFESGVSGGGDTCFVPDGGPGPVQATCAALVADFTGDGFVDFADYKLATGILLIHENLKNGTFAPPGLVWNTVTTDCAVPGCSVLVADFNTDGYADYAAIGNGDGTGTNAEYFVHNSLGNGAFPGIGSNWAIGWACHTDSDAVDKLCDVFLGDLNGDGYADAIDRSTNNGAISAFFSATVSLDPEHVATDDTKTPSFTGVTCIAADCEILGHSRSLTP